MRTSVVPVALKLSGSFVRVPPVPPELSETPQVNSVVLEVVQPTQLENVVPVVSPAKTTGIAFAEVAAATVMTPPRMKPPGIRQRTMNYSEHRLSRKPRHEVCQRCFPGA
jgi:hypothetical protein